jgi:hypothetical protein
MHAISALTNPGDSISYTTPDGRITVTLQYVREGAYRVDYYQGTYRVEDNCGSYPTEQIGRSVARLYAELAQAEAAQVPATLAEIAQQGSHRQVRPTVAGAHLAAVSDPQHRALATAATLGRVDRGAGPTRASVATLKAMARKGLVVLVMKPGKRYDISHATITEAGERELTRLDAAAANASQRAAPLARHL